LVIFTISHNRDNYDNIEAVTYNAEPAYIYNEENPLDAYMAKSGLDQETANPKFVGISECGFRFQPAITGKVNSFIMKLPHKNRTLRVTLWDATTKTIIMRKPYMTQREMF
jgi:hypothetical protein